MSNDPTIPEYMKSQPPVDQSQAPCPLEGCGHLLTFPNPAIIIHNHPLSSVVMIPHENQIVCPKCLTAYALFVVGANVNFKLEAVEPMSKVIVPDGRFPRIIGN